MIGGGEIDRLSENLVRFSVIWSLVYLHLEIQSSFGNEIGHLMTMPKILLVTQSDDYDAKECTDSARLQRLPLAKACKY